MMTRAVLLGLAAMAAVSANADPSEDWHAAGKDGCQCTANCIVWGDPHVINVWGDSYLQSGSPFTLLEGWGVEILGTTNNISPHHFLETVKWVVGKKTTLIKESQCGDDGKQLPDNLKFFEIKDGSNKINMTLSCHQVKPAQQGKLGDAFHLQADIFIDTASESVADAPLQGRCVKHSDMSDDEKEEYQGRTDIDAQTPSWVIFHPQECVCSASCSMIGDPHVSTLFQREALLKNQATEVTSAGKVVVEYDNIDIYSSHNFGITGSFSEDYWYMETVTVGGKTYTKADCPKNIRNPDKIAVIGTFDETLSKTDGNVFGNVVCAEETEGKRKGRRFLGLSMRRNTASGDQDFASIEAASGSTGACTAQPTKLTSSQTSVAQITKGTYLPVAVQTSTSAFDAVVQVSKGQTTSATMVQVSSNLRSAIRDKLQSN